MVLRFAISFSTPDGLVDSKSLGGSDGLAIGKVDRRVDCSSDGAIDGATTVYGAMSANSTVHPLVMSTVA